MSEPVRQAPAPFPGGPEPQGAPTVRRLPRLDDQQRSFLRMASHELRTPLNSILGFSEILAAELYGPLGAPQYSEYAKIIRQSGERLLHLVNQVLEIARLQGGVADMKLTPEGLDHVFDDVIEGLKAEAEARGVVIQNQHSGRLPTVMADARGLRTALTNLLENAITFSPEGGEVRLHARAFGDVVVVAVGDHGGGVDPADIPRLLKPFEQGESALTRRSEGAGLGLPIADLLCQAMGGRLRLYSEPGVGLTATIRLPAA